MIEQGGLSKIGEYCAPYPGRVAVFRFGDSFFSLGMAEILEKSFVEQGTAHITYKPSPHEPSPADVNEAATFLRENDCSCAVAIGGGSTIDLAKAACALCKNGDNIMEYVEGFSPKPFENKPLPLIAVPTTAGTGSECTKNAVITSVGYFKNSVRDDHMIPRIALIDATLMTAVSKKTTANSGADAVCQLVEAYVSKAANPLTDALSLHFTSIAEKALVRAFDDGSDLSAREDMALAALASGLCIANGGLGAAHGLAAGMGAITGLPHGFLCGVLLPHIMRTNIKKGIYKYAGLARSMGHKISDEKQASLKAVAIIQKLFDQICIPRDFKGCGIKKERIYEMLNISIKGSGMKKNPALLTREDCEQIISDLI